MSGLNRLATVIHRYGIGLIPNFIHYKKTKRTFTDLAKKIRTCKMVKLKGCSGKAVYFGEADTDSKRICDGERKILFYEDCAVKNCDIKYRWEKARYQHLYPLVLEGKSHDGYIFHELEDFFDGKHLTDTVSMEVAIALINALVSIQLWENRDLIDKERLSRALKDNMVYILENSENGIKYSNNHYFFNLLGLLWAIENTDMGMNADEFRKPIYKELLRLMTLMTDDDGFLYEGSTYYHRYVTEALLEFLHFNPSYEDSELKYMADRMVKALLAVSSSHNGVIGIGDNDSGRLLPLPSYFDYSSRCTETVNELSDLKCTADCETEVDIYFEHFGLYVYKDKHMMLSLRCDPIADKAKNRVLGGHYHNDQLELQLEYNGEEIFIDSGTYAYVYMNEYRRDNMRTDRHSTVVVEGVEQNTIQNNWVYTERTAMASLSEHKNGNVKAELKLDGGIRIVREVKTAADSIEIYDAVLDNSGRNCYSNYILSPSVSIKLNDKKNVLLTTEKLELELTANTDIKIKECYIAKEYGQMEKTKRICVECVNGKNAVRLRKRGIPHN